MKIFTDRENNLAVYIYANDHLPAHVHVFKNSKKPGKASIKINLGDHENCPEIVEVNGMNNKDAKTALRLVAKNQERFLKEWHKIHGFPKLD